LATKERSDRALKISNARILSAVYFGLLAVVFTLCLDATFYALGVFQAETSQYPEEKKEKSIPSLAASESGIAQTIWNLQMGL